MLFDKPNKSVGVDVGTHSVKCILMTKVGDRFRVDYAGYAPIDQNQANVDPIQAQADAVREALRTIPYGNSIMVGALPGQTVVIRYPRLPEASDAELQRAVNHEASQNLPYELSEVFVDWAVLDRLIEGEEAVVKVLLVAAKHELIESCVQVADAAGIDFSVLGVDSLALADAAEACDLLRVGETVALINIGATTTTIHFMRDGISSFHRDVNWGAREMVQAISKARRCDAALAEGLLREEGESSAAADTDEEPPPLPGESLPSAGFAPEEESLQPTPFEEQGPSELEDLGGSLLDPLEDEIEVIEEPPKPEEPVSSIGSGLTGEQPLEEILHAPLARLVTEIRRSFDYYEQQLYEHPVERVLLSGGVAHNGHLRQTLLEELGCEAVEVADPTESALFLGSEDCIADLRMRPAQFLVAVGLAVRGAAEL